MINILIRKVHDFLFLFFERNVSQYNKSNKHSSITFFFLTKKKKKHFFFIGYQVLEGTSVFILFYSSFKLDEPSTYYLVTPYYANEFF